MLWNNADVRKTAVWMLGLTAVFCIVGFCVHVWAGILCLVLGLLLYGIFLLFQRKRFRQLAELSGYLRRISLGDYTLDVRDNEEGELSILKSEIYKVTVMLSQYNEQLQKEKAYLADSIADISHQLKTPLTSMLVMVDLLGDSSLPEEKRAEFTGHIRTQLQRIEWLVSSLLKMSKLDAGVVQMKQETVCVGQLLEKAAAPLLIPLELKEQSLSMEGDKAMPLCCDVQWTAEALLNVLKNCSEHTQVGGKLSVSWSDNPIYTEIVITDNGEGIAKKDLPHIFNRFYRGQNSSSDSVGIGLAMARAVFRAQKGDILVESEKGLGTCFIIRLHKGVV